MRFSNILCLLISFSLIQCAALEELVLKPTVSYEKLTVKNLSFTDGTFSFRFQVNNPNSVGFTVRQINYNLQLNNSPFIKGELNKGIQLPANGTAFFEVPVTIQYFDFFKSIQDYIQLDQLPYSLNGSASIGPFTIPFDKTGNFSKPKLPNVSLKSISISEFSLAGASLELNVAMKNPNVFPVQFDGLDYDIKLSDISVANGNAEALKSIEKNGETDLKIPVNIGFLDLGTSVYQALKNSSVSYTITGHLKSKVADGKIMSFPFQKSGQVSISR